MKCLNTQTLKKSLINIASEFHGQNITKEYHKEFNQETKDIVQTLVKYILNLLFVEYNKNTEFDYRKRIVERFRDLLETMNNFYYSKL